MFDLTKLRPGQRAAHKVIVGRVMAGEQMTSVVLPTRYGKSDLMRLTSLVLQDSGAIAGSVALTPALFLRNQLCRKEDVHAMTTRYGVPYSRARLLGWCEPLSLQWFANNEYLIAMTMQSATLNRGVVREVIDSIKHTTGKPILFYIDECHQTSNKKARGDLVQTIAGCGCPVVLLTATAIRADGEIIPGFAVDTLDEKDCRKYVVTDKGDGVHNTVNVYDGIKKLVRLKADHETTFQEAWEERPSPLCRLSREAIDAEIAMPDGRSVMLSEMSASECRQYIGAATRQERVIRDGVCRMLEDLQCRRRIREDIAAIVFTGNDMAADAQDNRHANMIRDIIKQEQGRFGLRLSTIIATMKSAESDDAAAKKLKEFSELGNGDVLIVKQMGGAGLDAGRVKVVLDLSMVRTVASCIQRYMRAATPYEGIRTATVITLKDELAEGIWQKCIVEEGGSVSQWSDGEFEWVEAYDVEKGEEEIGDKGVVGDPELGALDDSDGNDADVTSYESAMLLISEFPELLNTRTKAEIASKAYCLFGSHATPAGDRDKPTVPVEIERERAAFNEFTRALANRDFNYGRNKTEWAEARKRYVMLAKQAAGVQGVKLEHITNVATLRAMTAFLDRQLSYGKE
jgi:hypothetical protein